MEKVNIFGLIVLKRTWNLRPTGDYSLSEKSMKLVLSGSEGEEYEAEVYPKRSLLSEVLLGF